MTINSNFFPTSLFHFKNVNQHIGNLCYRVVFFFSRYMLSYYQPFLNLENLENFA